MNNHIGESSTTTKTFRFGSGQILTLTEYQIAKIPYLTTLISAEHNFDSIRVDQGYYLLDSCIDYHAFIFVLDSISFNSARQIFTLLPKNCNVLMIIGLMDFLAIEHRRYPTLEEVDSNFFWNAEFGDKLGVYQCVYRPSDIQDVAVEFAIAMANEEYNFTDRKVIDQIYWFIMFILSAHKLFETHIRYHVYKIAQNCFSIYCRSLLECLYRLEQRTEKEIRKESMETNSHIQSDRENNVFWNSNTLNNDCTFYFWDFDHLTSKCRRCLTFRQCFCHMFIRSVRMTRNSSFFCDCRKQSYNMDQNCDSIRKKRLENMYKYLLGTVLEQVSAKIKDRELADLDEIKYKSILDDVLNRNTVHSIMHESIASEIRALIPKLEQQYVELVKEIQIDEQNSPEPNEDPIPNHSLSPYLKKPLSTLESKQSELLTCQLSLAKLHEFNSVMDEIRKAIMTDLHDLFMDEIQIFLDRREEMWILLNSIQFNPDKKT
ncbi:unnamed protein product [Rotaria magnacalcarata]|uniref:Uncharacterized protein n=2 Tax=Rotaria magnacalcarata TaxID=392030 RepID=A0A817ARM8_9BILA|nr:unnamed protein product [Rotaria magnacalcarata]CAF2271045.1 unnamed protein product [Rotaria magnacalcarata]CAF4106993.1 unnamed protein product [Rotaria magnacalcarata]CAF4161868.1 unnamed protein product [Rotaria magnacalcarata]